MTHTDENGALVIEEPVHEYFCLTYAAYQVIPRSIAQSMPVAWQRRFVRLMRQMDEECRRHGISMPSYTVYAHEKGIRITDPFRDYDRGRRDVFSEIQMSG